MFKRSEKSFEPADCYIGFDGITLSDFASSSENIAIRCHFEDNARRLLAAFARLGMKWSDGEDYNEYITYWRTYGKDTCYSNKGTYGGIKTFLHDSYLVYDLSEVDDDSMTTAYHRYDTAGSDLSRKEDLEARHVDFNGTLYHLL
jgi:hypothetical protein